MRKTIPALALLVAVLLHRAHAQTDRQKFEAAGEHQRVPMCVPVLDKMYSMFELALAQERSKGKDTSGPFRTAFNLGYRAEALTKIAERQDAALLKRMWEASAAPESTSREDYSAMTSRGGVGGAYPRYSRHRPAIALITHARLPATGGGGRVDSRGIRSPHG